MSASLRPPPLSGTSIVRTSSLASPLRTSDSCNIVRVSSPAPVKRITETAICATTSARCSRWRLSPPLMRLIPDEMSVPSFPSCASVGANEMITATMKLRRRVKPSTMPSMRISPARGE